MLNNDLGTAGAFSEIGIFEGCGEIGRNKFWTNLTNAKKEKKAEFEPKKRGIR